MIRFHCGNADLSQLERWPIIFICHSMGGIVVKKALKITTVDHLRYAPIFKATCAILFLATPHSGSAAANLGTVIANIANVASLGRVRNGLVALLKNNSHELSVIARDFRGLTENIKIYSFYEQVKTLSFGDVVSCLSSFVSQR